MKKKFMRGIAVFLAAVMMLPTTALADTLTDDPDGNNQEISQLSEGEGGGQGSGEEGEDTPPTPVTSIQLSADKNLIYAGGNNNKATITLTADGDIDESKITWNCLESNVSLSENGKTCTVTGNAKGKAQIVAMYGLTIVSEPIEIEVEARAIQDFDVTVTTKNLEYYTGESFDRDGIVVKIQYNDSEEWIPVTDYAVTPATFTEAGTNVKVTISYPNTEFKEEILVDVLQKEADTVKKVEFISPYDGMKVEKDSAINEVELLVTWNSGKMEKITATKTSPNGVTISGYTLGDKITKNTPITATYGNVTTAEIITIEVVEKTPEKTITGIEARPSKTEYTKGNTVAKSDVKVYVKYSDNSEKELASNQYTLSPTTLNTTGTVTITATMKLTNGTQYSDTYTVTVKDVISVTGLDKDDDEYKLWDDDEIELKVGDKLNDDVMWYDIFDEVNLIVDGKNKLIDSKNDLNDYPGVQLLLRVYSDGSDTIKASHVGSDGKVRLQLYVKNGTTSITSTSYSIREYVPVTEAECTVSIYSSKTSTSSSYLKASKSFDDFADALAAIESEDDLEDEFDVTLGSNYVIRIKFGEDQELSSSYEFEPDYYYENPIFIDLNGNELKLPSDWIVYDDCEDLVVSITNSNTKEDGKLVYRDKSSAALTVANGSTLEFSEGNIPTDTDAALTVKIYKSTSTTSSALIKTKVYEDLEDLLDDLEKQEDALETFDIDDDYEDEFVARIQFGEDEDQDISGYTFAPDYDAAIYIDLNGNKLTLDTDWIDYDSDNDGLSVKINNTNTDNATLYYKDESVTITVKKSDTSLEFKKDDIPGIYDISIGSMTNGKATMSKDTVGRGGSVKFTITPNSGYAIDTVKINSKTVSSTSYTVSSTGVGTYELKDITADSKLDVTFKKASSTTTEKEETKPSTTNWTNPFTDISKNAQYYDAVAFVCSEGLFNGMTATKFEPTTTMTRAMFVTVLGRLAGVDANRYSGTSFTDVSKTDQQISWAAPYIEWAVQNGITQGTGNGKFSPNDPITHQQMYLFMYRYAMFIENIPSNITNVSLSGITDASQIADWAQDGVKFASKNKILITSGGKLTPTENALRCELAMLLHGFCVKVLGYNG